MSYDFEIHPEMQVLIDAKAGLPPATTLEEMRNQWSSYVGETRQPYPDGMAVEDRAIPGPGGDIPVRVYRPAGVAALASCILYIHGGGFMKGNLDSSDAVAWGLAAQSKAVVVSIDYRLAPENPYPAAFDDCYAVLCHVAEHGAADGIDSGRIAVCGDSAGGNLSAAVCIAARDRRGPRIAVQGLVYPCLTDVLEGPAYSRFAVTPGLITASMQMYWDWYLAGTDRPSADPLATPLAAADLSNLPPAIIQVAEIDPLADDGRLYADALTAAGGTVRYRSATGMIHGFLRARFSGPDTAAEFAALCDFLRTHLG
jgi:acetyl esterase